ncbi:NUDIX domain-containing protein [Comamonas humi]
MSIKGVILPEPGKCVLALNDRDEWELSGGRIELGETPEEAVVREISEELRLKADVAGLIDCYLFEVIPSKHVFVVNYGCVLKEPLLPKLSYEHLNIQAFPVEDLPSNLPLGYQSSIKAWATAP